MLSLYPERKKEARGKMRFVQEGMKEGVMPAYWGWVVVALPAVEALKALLHMEGKSLQDLSNGLGYTFQHVSLVFKGGATYSDRFDTSLRAWLDLRCTGFDCEVMADALKEEADLLRRKMLNLKAQSRRGKRNKRSG